jgi:hypothetical protein
MNINKKYFDKENTDVTEQEYLEIINKSIYMVNKLLNAVEIQRHTKKAILSAIKRDEYIIRMDYFKYKRFVLNKLSKKNWLPDNFSIQYKILRETDTKESLLAKNITMH